MTSLARTASAVLAWFACGAAHELAHLIAACFLGCGTVVFSRENIWHALVSRRVQVTVDAQHWRACAIRASGWVTSVAVALACWRVPGETCQAVRVVATMTAAEALWTDLLGMEQKATMKRSAAVTAASLLPPHTWFYCGNFGMIILSKLWLTGSDGGELAKTILQKMVQVTMMRGAQSGGVVTFIGGHADDEMRDELKHDTKGLFGTRARVVNTKRGDLSVGVRSKLEAAEQSAVSRGLALRGRGRVYAGHTRFATTSKATFDGTHPHQWSPRSAAPDLVWLSRVRAARARRALGRELHLPQRRLRLLHGRRANVRPQRAAGVVAARDGAPDARVGRLLRGGGHARPAARAGLVVPGGALRVPPRRGRARRRRAHVAALPDPVARGAARGRGRVRHAFGERVRGGPGNSGPKTVVKLGFEGERAVLADEVAMALRAGGHAAALLLEPREPTGGGEDEKELEGGATLLETFARSTVDAFFDNDLLFVARLFMANAKGSFGLCLTCSIDAHRQVCLAARGQTISVAFFPRTGLVLYGSEQAAVKAALGVNPPKQPARKGSSGSEQAAASPSDAGRLAEKARARTVRAIDAVPVVASRPASPAEKSPGSSQRAKTKSFEQWKRDREGLEVWRQNDYEHGPAVRLDLDDLGGEASRVVGPTRGSNSRIDTSSIGVVAESSSSRSLRRRGRETTRARRIRMPLHTKIVLPCVRSTILTLSHARRVTPRPRMLGHVSLRHRSALVRIGVVVREVCLIDWGSHGDMADRASVAAPNRDLQTHWMNYKEVSITLHQESLHKFGKFTDRLVPLEDNPLVLPLPKSLATDMDPVATDLADIPRIVQNIQDDWNAPYGISLNRLTAWHLGRSLKKRFQARARGGSRTTRSTCS